MDLIELETIKHKPFKYQVENWLCQPESMKYLSSMNIEDVYLELTPLIERKNWFLADPEVKINSVEYDKFRTNAPSLALIEVEKIEIFNKNANKRRIRFYFEGTYWDLPFTDDFFNSSSYQLGRCLLCISIGEKWKNPHDPSNTWHYKLVAGIIELPQIKHRKTNNIRKDSNSLLSLCEEIFKFTPEVSEHRQKKVRFSSNGWVFQGLVNTLCPTCSTFSISIFRKHLRKFARDLHYWGIVCFQCENARDSKDFSKEFMKKINSEIEEIIPIGTICEICISNIDN
jgi:hypothetical protein